jgi:hypothetical protein
MAEEVHIKLPSHAVDGAVRAMLAVARCRCRGDVGHGVTSLLSHASFGNAESYLRCCCQVNIVHSAMSLPSHAGDGTAKVTWPWRDIVGESCW